MGRSLAKCRWVVRPSTLSSAWRRIFIADCFCGAGWQKASFGSISTGWMPSLSREGAAPGWGGRAALRGSCPSSPREQESRLASIGPIKLVVDGGRRLPRLDAGILNAPLRLTVVRCGLSCLRAALTYPE